jgi:hypothetical protein
MSRRVRIAWVPAALLLGVLAGCCKPKPGDACDKGKAACLDDKTELACQAGRYVAAPCKGPRGCAMVNKAIQCDITGNVAGDPCSTDDEGNGACASGAKTQIVCRGGRYALDTCRGPAGCKPVPEGSECDKTIAAVGEPCGKLAVGTDACSVDGKSILTCVGGAFALAHPCRGPGGCSLKESHAVCDRSVVDPGESCAELTVGRHACSTDGKSALTCRDGRFALDRACKGPKGCRVAGDQIECDGD